MNDNFNKLSPAETERLSILMEECGEVIHAIGKILRHGYEDYNPDVMPRRNNRYNLETELGDLQQAVMLCVKRNDVDGEHIQACAIKKGMKINKYLHHNIVK